MMQLQKFLGYISETKLYGVIPLDIIFHFSVGLIIAMIGVKFKIKYSRILTFLFVIALLKEFKDSSIIGPANTIEEHISDIFFTVVPALFVFMWLKAKSQLKKAKSMAK